MADKSKAQVLALIRAVSVTTLDAARTWLDGTFWTAMDAVSTAIDAGDDQPEDKAQKEALDDLKAAGANLYEKAVALVASIHPTLGRYGGSPDLDDQDTNVAYFHQKLVDDSEAVDSAGFTKFSSWTADGGNVGNGDFVVHNTDPNGTSMDVSHVETLTLKCLRGVTEGETAGAEVFEIIGTDKGADRWEEQGSSNTGGHLWKLGLVDSDYADGAGNSAAGLRSARVGSKDFKSQGVTTSAGNIVKNGDFAAALNGSGSDRIPNWVISSGGTTFTINTAVTPVFGSQSFEAEGNGTIYHLLPRIATNCPYVLRMHNYVNANVTAGTVTISVKDDSTTHASIAVDTTGLTNATWTKSTATTFVLPKQVGENLRVEIAVASYAGTDEILTDGVMLHKLTLVDGRAVGMMQGAVNWKRGDKATGATTASFAGSIQRAFNEAFNRYVEHASTGTYWTDA